jgi:molybdenum cofactor biosynthesis protein B
MPVGCRGTKVPRYARLHVTTGGILCAMSLVEHRRDAPASVRCFVLTISDTRGADTDPSGDAIAQALESAGHEIAGRALVRDEPDTVRDTIRATAPDVDAIVATGGTGITARDSTYEAVASLLQKRLDGFGELFRMLSYEQIGAAAMLSRACAGTIGTTVVFSLPGSTNAVRLALEKLIVPELPHLVRELRR